MSEEQTGKAERGHAPQWVSPVVLRRIGFAAFLVFFTWLYFFLGTHLIQQVNRDRLNWDQQHNIELAIKALEREHQPPGKDEGITAALWRQFPHYTEGVVNPLWPWMAARFAVEDDHERFFQKGKWFNLSLTAGFLIILGIIAARAWTYLSAVTLVLAGGLGSVLQRAHYFQPEPVYYILLFLAWVCALSLLRQNSLWHYGVLGFVLGLAYLAKTSVQPFLLVFFGVTFLRAGVEWFTARRKQETRENWSIPNQLIGTAVLVMTFLLAASPRLSFAREKFGDPFHSYPGYWMWLDRFEEGYEFMNQYSTPESLKSIPPDQKPSPANYLKNHTWGEVFARLTDGTKTKIGEMLFPHEIRKREGRQLLPQRGWILIFLAGMLGAVSIIHARAARRRDELVWPVGPQSAFWMLLFAFGTFAVSALAYGFYEPIGKGNRFMLSLYLPLLVTLIWIAERFRRQLLRAGQPQPVTSVFIAGHAAVILWMSWRMIALLRDPVFAAS